jgi:hypothetical protein
MGEKQFNMRVASNFTSGPMMQLPRCYLERVPDPSKHPNPNPDKQWKLQTHTYKTNYHLGVSKSRHGKYLRNQRTSV